MTDGARRRVFVRRIPLQHGFDAVARESVLFVVESSLEAMLAGQEIGVSREEYRRELEATRVPAPAVVQPSRSRAGRRHAIADRRHRRRRLRRHGPGLRRGGPRAQHRARILVAPPSLRRRAPRRRAGSCRRRRRGRAPVDRRGAAVGCGAAVVARRPVVHRRRRRWLRRDPGPAAGVGAGARTDGDVLGGRRLAARLRRARLVRGPIRARARRGRGRSSADRALPGDQHRPPRARCSFPCACARPRPSRWACACDDARQKLRTLASPRFEDASRPLRSDGTGWTRRSRTPKDRPPSCRRCSARRSPRAIEGARSSAAPSGRDPRGGPARGAGRNQRAASRVQRGIQILPVRIDRGQLHDVLPGRA